MSNRATSDRETAPAFWNSAARAIRKGSSLPNRLIARYLIRPSVGLTHRLSNGRLFGLHAYFYELNDREMVSHPGMLSPHERAFLKFFVGNYLQGVGAVVELGVFLGSSTVAICKGLRQLQTRTGRSIRLVCMDTFACDKYMCDVLRELHSAGLTSRPVSIGESFEPLFRELTVKFKDSIELRLADCSTVRSDIPAEIEFLVVDVMKDIGTCSSVARQFYPLVLPGVGHLFHQDFTHYYTSWIPVQMFQLRDHFEPVFHVPGSSSMLFRCVSAPPEARLAEWSFLDCSDQCVDDAFAFFAPHVKDAASRANLNAAHVMAFIHRGNRERAASLFEDYEQAANQPPSEMSLVREQLRTLGNCAR
jgi:hypothetical protein